MKHDLFDENLEKEENWKVDLIVTGLIDRVDIFWLYVAQLIQNVFFEDGDMLMTVAYIFIGWNLPKITSTYRNDLSQIVTNIHHLNKRIFFFEYFSLERYKCIINEIIESS